MTERRAQGAGASGHGPGHSGIGTGLAKTVTLYEHYSAALRGWLRAAKKDPKDKIPGADATDELMARLAEAEANFIEAAMVRGAELEEYRKRIAMRRGRDLTLHEIAVEEGALEEFDSAEKAVAEVCRLRVKALRAMEVLKKHIQAEIDEISRVKRLRKVYSSSRDPGQRLNGQG